MSDEKKPYKTTALAGFYVAGQKIPARQDTGSAGLVPVVGHVLQLTEAEAKYELLAGSIEPAEPAPAEPPQPRRSSRGERAE